MSELQPTDTGPQWGEREQKRFAFRVGLFTRRGMTQPDAETLADRLFERDAERDDRRVCVECAHITADHPRHGRGCFAAQQGWIHGAARNLSPIPDLLLRCEAFAWQMPN